MQCEHGTDEDCGYCEESEPHSAKETRMYRDSDDGDGIEVPDHP